MAKLEIGCHGLVLREIAPGPNSLGNFPGTGRRPKFALAK